MPSAERVRWSQLRIGVVVLVALFILAVLIFLLTSSLGIFQHYFTIKTFMSDAAGMAKGAPVRLNGIIVGNVANIKLSGLKNPRQAVEFDMSVNDDFMDEIPVDSLTEISAANLLGDKFINITKGASTRHVANNSVLPSKEAQDIPELMAESANLLQTLQTITNRVDAMLAGIDQGKGNLGKLLKDEQLYDRLNGIAAEGQQLLADVRNGKGTLSRLIYDDQLYSDIRAPLKRIDTMLDDLQQGRGTAGMLLRDPALYDEAHGSIVELRRLIDNLNAGHGTAGKLLNDDALYTQLNQLVARLDSTVGKINSGQGTLGQLMVNPELYQALTGATREFQGLAHDFRTNPKKFLRIKLALF